MSTKANKNIKLWITSDKGLYSLAQSFMRDMNNKDEAARSMMGYLRAEETFFTPDGYKYTQTGIRYAMIGMVLDN